MDSSHETSIDEGEELVTGTSPYQLFAIEEGSLEVRRDGERLATLGAERSWASAASWNGACGTHPQWRPTTRRSSSGCAEILAERGG